LSGAEQDAGVGDLFRARCARAAADATSGAGGIESLAGAFDDLLALKKSFLESGLRPPRVG
jgi:hypothetical protein